MGENLTIEQIFLVLLSATAVFVFNTVMSYRNKNKIQYESQRFVLETAKEANRRAEEIEELRLVTKTIYKKLKTSLQTQEQLKKQLMSKDEERKKLINTIRQLRNQYYKLSLSFEQFKNDKQKLEKELEARNKEIATLIKALGNVKDENIKLLQELERCRDD